MDDDDPTPMQRLGRYELLGSLGSGGMGDVHRARAYGAAGTVKELCIKRIRPSRLSDAAAVERFVSEARLSMRLSHNNIVPVFDFGRADGQYFLAMEWVDGSDLRSLLREGPMPACVAAHVAAEVARALDYAHALPEGQGGPLIHRDVKPGNVLISAAGDVKLVDFGVAVAGAMDTQGRVGTLAYMAPEQERGEPVDGRADLFSLGVVLAEMLGLGRPRRPRELPEETPAGVADVLRRLLAEQPAGRPLSAKLVASELEDLVARHRVAGEDAPRDSLRERVEAMRVSIPGVGGDGEVWATDLSYLRDGEERTLGSILGATGSTAADLPAAQDPERRAPTQESNARRSARAGRWIALGGLLVLFVAAAAWRFGGARAEPTTASVGEPVSTLETASSLQAEGGAQERRGDPVRVPSPRAVARGGDAPAPSASTGRSSEARRSRGDARTPAHATKRRGSLHAARRDTRQTAPSRAPEGTSRAEPSANVEQEHEPDTQAGARPATVDINAAPWAQVFLDGRDLGTTPLFDLRVSAGAHLLRLENGPLGRSRSLRLSLAAASHRRVVVDMLEDEPPIGGDGEAGREIRTDDRALKE